MEDFEQQLPTTPQNLTADAGYSSEQNYELLETKKIKAFVKYNYFDKDQQGKRNSFAADQLYYNSKEDYIICPHGSAHAKCRYF